MNDHGQAFPRGRVIVLISNPLILKSMVKLLRNDDVAVLLFLEFSLFFDRQFRFFSLFLFAFVFLSRFTHSDLSFVCCFQKEHSS